MHPLITSKQMIWILDWSCKESCHMDVSGNQKTPKDTLTPWEEHLINLLEIFFSTSSSPYATPLDPGPNRIRLGSGAFSPVLDPPVVDTGLGCRVGTGRPGESWDVLSLWIHCHLLRYGDGRFM